MLWAAAPAMGQSGPVGHWKLDDGSGRAIVDSSGAAQTGTFVNTPTWNAAGRIGGALTFGSPNAAVTVPGGAGIANLYSTGMSISVWIKPTSAGGGGKGRIADKTGWMLRMGSATTLEFIADQWTTTAAQRLSAGSIVSGASAPWQHVVATWDGQQNAGAVGGAGIHLYVNGVPADGAAINGAGNVTSDSSIALGIGNGPSSLNRGFAGSLDDLRIYNRVLTAVDIQALADSSAPSAPASPTATAISSSQIDLGWAASTDNVAVSGYRIERCAGANCTAFAEIASAAAGSYRDTGLATATFYRYRIRATDANANLGPYSSPLVGAQTFTAAPVADTQVPTVPGTPSATAVSPGQIDLAWAASSDNIAVTGYLVERCLGASCAGFAQVASPATNSYSDTGLLAATGYRYRVRARDAADNRSAYSAAVTVTTLIGGGIAGSATYQYDSFGRLKQVVVNPQ